MKRLASLVLAAGFVFSLLLATGQGAFATPFSDVPANHWAYQALQSLAADGLVEGYPDGKFKGDRPLSRYEMAVLTARVIAKVEANGASKADLDKLQKLIDALKDELDALGVRVSNLEDALDALDKRTKFAQSVEFHGLFTPNVTERERIQYAQNVNGSGLAPEPVGNFVNAFLYTGDSNNPLAAIGPGIRIRNEDKFAFTYHVTDQIDVSLPVHMLTYEYGGEYPTGSTAPHMTFDPSLAIKVAKAGALTNLVFRFGQITDMQPSRTGLTFTPPSGTGDGYFPPYTYPLQPSQRGISVAGTLLGLTDFRASFTRVDQTLLTTQPGCCPDPSGDGGIVGYLGAVLPNQNGALQVNAAGVLTTNTFAAGTGPLSQVYLTQKGVLGSVFVSAYNGATYNSNRTLIAGPPGSLAAAPVFTYNDQFNAVVFNPPIPAGSTVSISYTGLGYTGNTGYQRYMVNARINQRIKGWQGAEIGVTFNRIFDFDDLNVSGNQSVAFQSPVQGFGAVSDTVLGIDFQLPLPYEVSGKGSNPVIFGEAAASKFTADYRNVPAQTDTAGVIGLRLKIQKADLSATYQSIGPGYLDGAPFRYYGNAPALFSFWKLPYFPNFYGFANNIGINLQLDNALAGAGPMKNPGTANNPNLTFLYPVFNQFQGGGPFFFQNAAYTPNTRGPSLNITAPIKLGDTTFNARLLARSLSEIRPNSFGQLVFGPGGASNVLETDNTVGGGVGVSLPAFGQKVSLDVAGSWEKLRRNDLTPSAYLPLNPSTGSIDAATAGAVATAFGINPSTGAPNSPVSFYPNYVNDTKWTFSLKATVPVTRDVSLFGYYNTQRFGGSYGTTQTQNISQKKDFYIEAVTYSIPKTTSSLAFNMLQQRYTDDVLPSFNIRQNVQNVVFTVRF